MVKHTTRWSPDTCSCQIEYEWDDADPLENRRHIFSNLIKSCPDHAHLSGQDIFNVLMDENPRKNKAITLVKEATPALARSSQNQDQDQDYQFHWTGKAPNRVIHIDSNLKMSHTEHDELVKKIKDEFGAKVVIL